MCLQGRKWGASVFQPVSQRQGACGKGKVSVGLSPSEGQPEGPDYQSSSWSVKRRVCVYEWVGE